MFAAHKEAVHAIGHGGELAHRDVADQHAAGVHVDEVARSQPRFGGPQRHAGLGMRLCVGFEHLVGMRAGAHGATEQRQRKHDDGAGGHQRSAHESHAGVRGRPDPFPAGVPRCVNAVPRALMLQKIKRATAAIAASNAASNATRAAVDSNQPPTENQGAYSPTKVTIRRGRRIARKRTGKPSQPPRRPATRTATAVSMRRHATATAAPAPSVSA